jgi:hypothetical protein
VATTERSTRHNVERLRKRFPARGQHDLQSNRPRETRLSVVVLHGRTSSARCRNAKGVPESPDRLYSRGSRSTPVRPMRMTLGERPRDHGLYAFSKTAKCDLFRAATPAAWGCRPQSSVVLPRCDRGDVGRRRRAKGIALCRHARSVHAVCHGPSSSSPAAAPLSGRGKTVPMMMPGATWCASEPRLSMPALAFLAPVDAMLAR